MFAINTRGKNVKSLPPSRYDVESKFKSILDLSNKLESQITQAKSFRQLYTSSLLNLRERLCDEIKIIFRYAPIEYGRLCEEILWKRNYYDYVKFCKKYRKQIDNNELAIFRMHITSGIGHYQSLCVSFRKAFNLTMLDDFVSYLPAKQKLFYKLPEMSKRSEIPSLINPNYNPSNNDDDDNESTLDENDHIGQIEDDDERDAHENELDSEYVQDEKFLPTLSFLAHRFCICLGDLARYYVDFFPLDNSKTSTENRFSHYYFNIASFYYKSASIIQPSLGMPFNQLGTLYTGSYWGLDSLYFYMRCLNSKKSFPGVRANMRQIFESTNKALSLLNSTDNSSKLKPNSTQDSTSKPVREAILRLINLFFEFFNIKTSLKEGNAPLNVTKVTLAINETLSKISLALNVEPSRTFSRTSPGSLSTESIFQIFSIYAILIEQIKISLSENATEVKFEDIKFLKSQDVLTDIHQKGNFLLLASYRFLFQFLTLLLRRENQLLRKWISNIPIINPKLLKLPNSSFSNVAKHGGKPRLGQSRKVLATSFSSDFNDMGEDSAMLNQLKSTAMQSIDALFDQSDNEEVEEMNGNQNKDDSDTESVSDLIDKLIFSDEEENDLMGGSLIDEAIDRSTATHSHSKLNSKVDKQSSTKNAPAKDSINMDQLLSYIYTQSYTPVIKFFCDFLQSNGDFLDLFQQLDVLHHFFEAFFDYLNLVSEFDLKLVATFGHYLSKRLQVDNERDPQIIQALVELNFMINVFSSEKVTEFDQKFPLSSEIDFLHITEELSAYFEQLFGLSADSCTNYHKISQNINYSCEQYGYLCMRSILVFGVKLATLSLASNTFQLSLEGYDGNIIHTSRQERPVKFIFTQIRSNSAILSPFAVESSIVNPTKPQPVNKLANNEPLISFSDNNDNEVPIATGSEVNPRAKADKKKFNMTNNNNNNDYKSLHEISKLPFVMIDPYVYLENLKFVSDLVKQKKAFLVVPKLATDFLDNIKKRNEKAQQASEFLFQEFFCGSRIIRFIRNDDRMDLETLNYPRYQWRRDIDVSEASQIEKMMNDMSKVRVQDLALFYELLEHCHYLLVNKVLVDKSQDAKPLNGNSDEIRITLITNNLAKWPPAASEIAHAFGIDIETIQSFQEKQAQNRFDKQAKQSKSRKPFKPAQQNSPMFFKPIHNPRNEMYLSNPLT